MARNPPEYVLAIRILEAVQVAALKRITSQTSRLFVSLEAGMSSGKFKSAFRQANQEIAAVMAEDVLFSYDERVEARKPDQPTYRARNNRRSGGILRQALDNPNLVVADSTKISYVNVKTLDRVAKHWQRLNFGAGPRGLSLYRGQGFAVKFGRKLGTVRDTTPPRPGFTMPFGIWVGQVPESRLPRRLRNKPAGFYPLSSRRQFPTEGIPGRRFLDAGLKAFAVEMPAVYQEVIDDIVASASKAAKKAAGV